MIEVEVPQVQPRNWRRRTAEDADVDRAAEVLTEEGRVFDYESLYDRIAGIYGLTAPLWWGYIARALPWTPAEGPVLEIGPGPGYLLVALTRRGSAFGLDLSSRMLRQARRRLTKASLRAPLVQGDAAHLPFADRSFQAVVLTFTFSAVPDGPGALREMKRVLRPGERVVIVDAGIPEDRNRMALFLARQWERFGDRMRDEAALMESIGLTVVHREEFGPWRCMRVVVGEK